MMTGMAPKLIKAGGAVQIGVGVYDIGSNAYKEKGFGTQTQLATGRTAGGFGGAMIGAQTGAAIGSTFACVGAIPGFVIGGLIGGIGGGYIGAYGGEAIVRKIQKP